MSVAGDNCVKIDQFKVLMVTGQRLEGRQGILTESGLDGFVADTSVSFQREHIRRVYKHNGSKAIQGLAIGGGSAFALSFVMAYSPHHDSESSTSREAGVALFTGAGAVIGLVIGLMTDSWKDVPLGTTVGFQPEKGNARLVLSVSF